MIISCLKVQMDCVTTFCVSALVMLYAAEPYNQNYLTHIGVKHFIFISQLM